MPRTTTLPKDFIVARYNAGETIQVLADEYGRNYATMRENLHRWGADMRRRGPPRTYTLDESFFDVIDTEAKAYWLGFAFADGGLNVTGAGNWVFRVQLKRSDEGHLYKLRTDLCSDAPVVPYDPTESSYLDICSVRICNALARYGCVQAKTYTDLHTPELPAEYLYRHFYRGLTDGDGGIRPWPKGHYWIFDTIGSPTLMAEYQAWLVANADLEPTKRIAKGITETIQYNGGAQVERIARLLYEKCTVFLDRKYAAYQELLHRPGAGLRVI
jgi:hypothetical protein